MRLSRISDNVQKIAEAISSVLEVDVTICDASLVRIAATGLYADRIGDRISANSIFGYAVREGKDYIIDNPRTNIVCLSCDRRDECREVAEVCSPIFHEGDIIGVIGLIAFEDSQKRRLLRNKTNLLVFLKRMGDLISAKVSDDEKTERIKLLANELQAVIDFFDKGVIFADPEGRLLHANQKARAILGAEAEGKLPQPAMDFMEHVQSLKPGKRDGGTLKNREYAFPGPEGEVRLIFDHTPMGKEGERIGFLLSFSLKDDVLSVLNDVAGSGPDITFDDILGDSPELTRAKELARKASRSTSTILVQGESGTGKELFARSIHHDSDRRQMPFIPVNCAAIPENLLESELFGYEEGAFTGAVRGGKTGKFELAHKGTIFLDEIGDMPLHLQKKLLRVLQGKTIEKIGGKHGLKVDIRVIAATNKDIEQQVAEGAFREDLFYRLNVIPLQVPPLRKRREDVPLLTGHFIMKYSDKLKKDLTGIRKEALECLQAYDWPGNVRELENALEYAVNMCTKSTIALGDLPRRLIEKTAPRGPDAETEETVNSIESLERLEIRKALSKYGRTEKGIQSAVRDLGISRATLYRKIKKYAL